MPDGSSSTGRSKAIVDQWLKEKPKTVGEIFEKDPHAWVLAPDAPRSQPFWRGRHEFLRRRRPTSTWTDALSGLYISDERKERGLRNILANYMNNIQIIKSITLLTSGAVEVVRARGANFDQTDRTEWVDITSEQSNYLLYKMGFDFYSLITAEDYAIAHDLLQIHSGRSNFQSMSGIAGIDQSEEYSIELLYRGLNSMSSNVLKHLIISDVVNIGVPSSSSTSMKIAESFANKNDPWRIMLVIKNPEHIGLDAETLSFYEKEKEVIISGTINVETIELKDMKFTNETKFSAQAGDIDTNDNKKKMLEVINASGNDRIALIRRLGITSPLSAIWVFTGTIG